MRGTGHASGILLEPFNDGSEKPEEYQAFQDSSQKRTVAKDGNKPE